MHLEAQNFLGNAHRREKQSIFVMVTPLQLRKPAMGGARRCLPGISSRY